MIKTLKALENLKPGKIKSIGRKGDKFKVNFGKTWAMIDRFASGKGKACFKKLNDENVPNELGKFYRKIFERLTLNTYPLLFRVAYDIPHISLHIDICHFK